MSNAGDAPLQIGAPSIGPGEPFAVSLNTAFTVAPGASQVLTVTFSPTAEGPFAGTLTLTTDDPERPQASVALSGTGVAFAAELSPGSLSFGEQRVGTSSAPLMVTVYNAGSSPLAISSAAISGPFTLVSPPALPVSLAPGASQSLAVGFGPTFEGVATGTLTLTTDEPGRSSIAVALTGSGVKPAIAVSPTALDFGSQRVAQTSGVQPLIITNTGTAELMITQLLLSHPTFAISSPLPLPTEGMPMRIAPGEQKPLGVTFTPRDLGLVEGKLHILSNASAPISPVGLTGKGVDGQLGLTPGVVSFSSVDVGALGAQQSVVLTNTGAHPLTVTKLTPPAEPAFTLTGLSPGLVLNPGEQRTFTVTFSPTLRGHVSTSAIIHGDAAINPELMLALSGTGVAPAVELLPRELAFGKSNVGVAMLRELAIKNVGERDLSVSNIAFEDVTAGAALDFSVDGAATFPLVVKPGESSLVQVKFSPRMVGLREARVIAYTNDRAAEAKLQGEGTSPNLELSSSRVDFGNVLVGKPSAPRVLELINTGSGPLTLFSLTLGGVDAAAFSLTSAMLPISLLPGASTEVSLSLRVDAERQFSALLMLGTNDPDAPSVAVPLSGMGVGHVIMFSPSSLELGQQLINTTSSPRTVRVTNAGDTRVALTALSVEGQGASQFSLAPLPLPLVLEPGQQQEVSVSFTPLDAVDASCVLKFSFGDLPQPYEVELHGKGIPAVLSVKPSPLDFGTVRPGGGKREQPLTLTNVSSETITLAAPEVAYQTGEPFTLNAASLQGRTLEPGRSIIVPVGYQPAVETLSGATLTFGTTTPDQPRAVDLEVKGLATKNLLFADPGSLNFGRVDVSAPELRKEVTLVNRSSQPQWAVVKLKNPEGSPFSVVEATALAEPIPPAGRVTFKVAFLPQVQGEAHNELQVFLQGEAEADALISMSGTGYGGSTEQSGGCSCGSTEAGSSGMLMLLALVGLGARRRRLG